MLPSCAPCDTFVYNRAEWVRAKMGSVSRDRPVVGLAVSVIASEVTCSPEFSKRRDHFTETKAHAKLTPSVGAAAWQAHLQAHSRFARLGDSRGIFKEMCSQTDCLARGRKHGLSCGL